jgi:hypothetical protein
MMFIRCDEDDDDDDYFIRTVEWNWVIDCDCCYDTYYNYTDTYDSCMILFANNDDDDDDDYIGTVEWNWVIDCDCCYDICYNYTDTYYSYIILMTYAWYYLQIMTMMMIIWGAVKWNWLIS